MLDDLLVIGGGKGTRMAQFMPGVPKLMLPLQSNETVLSNLVSEFKPSRLFLALGNGNKSIQLPPRMSAVQIRSTVEARPLGTLGALKKLVETFYDELHDIFPVILGDLVCSEFDKYQKDNLQSVLNENKNCFFYSKNNHPYDSDRVLVKNDDEIEELIRKNSEYPHFCNRTLSGLYVFLKKDIAAMPSETGDIVHDLLPWLLERCTVSCRQMTGTLSDIGTPERYTDIVLSGKYLAERKYLFFDLDGTLITDRGSSLVAKKQPILLKKISVEIIKTAQRMGHKIILVTNQGDIAKGFKSHDEFISSILKLEEKLWDQGVWIDDYFYCPHYPERGFAGEVVELKIKCECRKPEIGMFLQARDKWNCDPTGSVMIGDSPADEQFADSINMKFFDINMLANNAGVLEKLYEWMER